MKFAIEKTALILVIRALSSISGGRTTLPILSNVFIQLKDKKLSFIGTDLVVTIKCVLPMESGNEGITTVPSKKLFDIVTALPNGQINFESDDKFVTTITMLNSEYNINGHSPEDFPAYKPIIKPALFTIGNGTLLGLIQRTSFCTSTDNCRGTLNNLYFSVDGNVITVVGTDGRRLACEKSDVKFDGIVSALIPKEGFRELLRILGDDGDVQVAIGEQHARFTIEREEMTCELTTQLVDGKFPNWRQSVPEKHKVTVIVGREVLIASINRAQSMADEKNNSVKLSFTKTKLQINARSEVNGKASEVLEITKTGDDIVLAVNPKYLADGIKVIADDTINIEMTDEFGAVLVRGAGSWFYIVMPLRLS